MTSSNHVSFIMILRELAWLRIFWRTVGWPNLVTWPDLGAKKNQNVGNECSLKFRKFQPSLSSRLAMAHEKPEVGGSQAFPPPANNMVKTCHLLCRSLAERGSFFLAAIACRLTPSCSVGLAVAQHRQTDRVSTDPSGHRGCCDGTLHRDCLQRQVQRQPAAESAAPGCIWGLFHVTIVRLTDVRSSRRENVRPLSLRTFRQFHVTYIRRRSYAGRTYDYSQRWNCIILMS